MDIKYYFLLQSCDKKTYDLFTSTHNLNLAEIYFLQNILSKQ